MLTAQKKKGTQRVSQKMNEILKIKLSALERESELLAKILVLQNELALAASTPPTPPTPAEVRCNHCGVSGNTKIICTECQKMFCSQKCARFCARSVHCQSLGETHRRPICLYCVEIIKTKIQQHQHQHKQRQQGDLIKF